MCQWTAILCLRGFRGVVSGQRCVRVLKVAAVMPTLYLRSILRAKLASNPGLHSFRSSALCIRRALTTTEDGGIITFP